MTISTVSYHTRELFNKLSKTIRDTGPPYKMKKTSEDHPDAFSYRFILTTYLDKLFQ